VLTATVVAVAVWRHAIPESIAVAVAAAALARRVSLAVGLVAIAVVAGVRSADAVESLAPDVVGPFAGWTTVAADPQPLAGSTRVVIAVDGERFEVWARGRATQQRVAGWRQGDRVWVVGERRPLPAVRAARVAWQHVVGVLDVETLGDRRAGHRLAVASNRVRDLIERGTTAMAPADAALARGLIIGDDRDQPPAMVERFRRSGLSHLTAVSGQNVALVLAAAGPLLRRTSPGTRVVLSLVLIAWFAVLTRAEPSVLRAGAMAGLGAVGYALGREREPPRLLAVAVIGLLLVDPLLVRSIGFWLSVGATAGVTIAGGPLSRRLAPLGPLAPPLGVTLGAQLGVALPSLLVFGRLPLVGTAANLVAVPVAGFVMLYGLPASLLAGAVSPVRGLVMLPIDVGVRIVDRVAAVAAAAEPPAPWNVVGWVLVALAIVALVSPRRRSPPGRLPE
jgi:competence protein ComEC